MAHLIYLPAFLFGFALAGSAPVLAACVRWRWTGAAMGVLGYGFILAVELGLNGDAPRWIGTPPGAGRVLAGGGGGAYAVAAADVGLWNGA